MRNFVGVTKPIKMVTMLRDVHSHRLSMVRKYVAKNLLEELIARKIKPHNTRLESICFADWLSLDGPDVHWRNQTYSQPQLGPQPIGYKVVKLDGARSYQLKWVARGRKHPGEGECGSNSQEATEMCSDDALLKQGQLALLHDYAYFGLLNRFHDSMCLFHWVTRLAWPETSTFVCSSNLNLECLKNTSCSPPGVCPSDHGESNI